VFVPDEMLIEHGSEETPIVRRCRERAPGVPVRVIDDREALRGQEFSAAKRRLLLAPRRGAFLEHCPAGTRGMACCNYLVLTFASNCPMDCGYCFLQDYLADAPALTAYVNPDDALAEVGRLLDAHPGRRFRIGTGELADSLALDPLTGLSRDLVPFFAARPNALLELKTKTDCVDDLVAMDPRERVVVSWSLAPGSAMRFAETGTASLPARFAAMRRAADAGYKIGVHLDPLIEHEGWEEGYRDLVHAIASAVSAARVAWVSMGALRLSPALRTRMRARFPGTPLLAGEQVPAADGKWRDFQPLRVRMYRSVRRLVEDALPHVPLYLCMETPDVWERVFGAAPLRDQELGALLAAR
jgi:spore photoproduct lyase